MKTNTILYLAAGAALAAVAAAGPALAGVGLSIGVGSPGFYGAIDIGGGVPPPAVVYQQPMLIGPAAVGAEPLYLYAPPEQYSRWGDYCGYYDACNRPVYFVQSGWYQNVYVPHYRSHRSYYEQRRGRFDQHVYRPQGRDMHRAGPAPRGRFDSHPSGMAGHQGMAAPARRFDSHPSGMAGHQGMAAPAAHSGNAHVHGRDGHEK